MQGFLRIGERCSIGSQCFLYESCEVTRKYSSDTWCFKIGAISGGATQAANPCAASGPDTVLNLEAACDASRSRPAVRYVRLVKTSVTADHCPRTGITRFTDPSGNDIPVASAEW